TASADTVPESAHDDQGPGHQEPVDVDDPEQLSARRSESGAEAGHGEMEDRQVHRVEEAGQSQHSQADPLAPSGARDLVHDTPSMGRILIDPLDPKTDDRRYGNSPAAPDISTSRRAVRVDGFRLEGPPPRPGERPSGCGLVSRAS